MLYECASPPARPVRRCAPHFFLSFPPFVGSSLTQKTQVRRGAAGCAVLGLGRASTMLVRRPPSSSEDSESAEEDSAEDEARRQEEAPGERTQHLDGADDNFKSLIGGGTVFAVGAPPSMLHRTSLGQPLPATIYATCPRHMKGRLAWLAWVAVGEKRENAPARSNGHHQWPGAHRECCAGVQPCVRAGLRGSRLSQVLNTLHLRLSVLKQCVTPLHDAFSYVQVVPIGSGLTAVRVQRRSSWLDMVC